MRAAVALVALALVVAGCLAEQRRDPPPVTSVDQAEARAEAERILDYCENADYVETCRLDELRKDLRARGAIYAFDVLDQMSVIDREIESDAHAISHEVGRFALLHYGTIEETVANCSLKVFQGCYHGAIQAHFEGLPRIGERDVQGVCPEGSTFIVYACTHGLGHGIFLATEGALDQTMDFCATLGTDWARQSCYGGAIMENDLGFIDNETGRGHSHGDKQPKYWVNKSDPAYPCNALAAAYQNACWLFHTSFVLYVNGRDFEGVFDLCDGLAAPLNRTCYESLGRDVSNQVLRDSTQAARYCHLRDGEARRLCVQGFTQEVMTNAADPAAALATCRGFPESDKRACYFTLGWGGYGISPSAVESVCDQAESAYVERCKNGVRWAQGRGFEGP